MKNSFAYAYSSKMATGNMYSASFNNEINNETLQFTAGFTFIDFLPEVDKPRRIFKAATYENFRTLVDRANEFLRFNRKWKIVTCESVEFKNKGDKIDPLKMTYLEYGESNTSYIRGLRLWLTERKDDSESEQQIGYVNLIPQQLEKKIFRAQKYESLDTVIERFNLMQQSNPLPGRIITIENQEMKITNFKKFDPDRSNWYECGEHTTVFLYILRIFYEITDSTREEIGVKDFIPDIISEPACCSPPEYELFPNIVKRAEAWLTQQHDLRFCNAQSVKMKLMIGYEVDTQRMDYWESGNSSTAYIRVLRVVFTKGHFTNDYSVHEHASHIKELSCRTFLPAQLTTGYNAKYENLHVTRERISAWVNATGCRVLSAETAAYRIKTGGERKQGPDASFTYNREGLNEYWIFVIRLYLDGIYKEPPSEMLPALPVIVDDNSCNIL